MYSRVFFGDKVVTIWDGTYLYIHKSQNYEKSRKTFCMAKHRHLMKVMSICFADGYVLDSIGLYFSDGHNNDASMMIDILGDEEIPTLKELEKNGLESILEWFKKKEHCAVVDRGFRNALDKLTSLSNMTIKMPSMFPKGAKQHTIEEANASRLVTKVRFVVECHHGRFKKWNFFTNVQPTANIKRMQKSLRILCAALNAFRPPIYNTEDTREMHERIAERMLERSAMIKNPLFERVEQGPLSSRGRLFTAIRPDEYPLTSHQAYAIVQGFPKLSLSVIKDHITCGTYQVEQARHYCNEHMASNDSAFVFYIHKAANDLIRARVQSRHKSATKYFVWVQFTSTEVKGHYCQCKAGMRTVGCCAHVATIIWYLGYARHNNYTPPSGIHRYWKKVTDCNGEPDSDEEKDPEPE